MAKEVQSVRQEGVTEAETQGEARPGVAGVPGKRPRTQETHVRGAAQSVPTTDSGVIKMFSRPFETKQRKTLFRGDNNGSSFDVALFIYLFFNSYYHCNSSLAARRLQCEQF